MPISDYKCDKCSEITEHEHAETPATCACGGNINRIWAAPTILKVQGGGGSPTRFSK